MREITKYPKPILDVFYRGRYRPVTFNSSFTIKKIVWWHSDFFSARELKNIFLLVYFKKSLIGQNSYLRLLTKSSALDFNWFLNL